MLDALGCRYFDDRSPHYRQTGVVTRQPMPAEGLLHSLEPELFSSLPRADQRRRGTDYILGLLRTQGRKTTRKMALTLDGSSNGQQLHHFVSSSTWRWSSVRSSLGEILLSRTPVDAWVVRPVLVVKSGLKSVGVRKLQMPGTQQRVNAQQAFGVWAAGPLFASPVTWRLQLTEYWLSEQRRAEAGIPPDLRPETGSECAIQACLKLRDRLGLPARPFVLDIAGHDAVESFELACAARLPVLARIPHDTSLLLRDYGSRGLGFTEQYPANRMVAAVTRDAAPGTEPFTHTVPVALPDRPDLDLLLVAMRSRPGAGLASYWLTNIAPAEPAELRRLCAYAKQVTYALPDALNIGMHDYVGRSFGGWHRHMTLVSAAHALRALTVNDLDR